MVMLLPRPTEPKPRLVPPSLGGARRIDDPELRAASELNRQHETAEDLWDRLEWQLYRLDAVESGHCGGPGGDFIRDAIDIVNTQRREAVERKLVSLSTKDPDWWAFLTPNEVEIFSGIRVMSMGDYYPFPPKNWSALQK